MFILYGVSIHVLFLEQPSAFWNIIIYTYLPADKANITKIIVAIKIQIRPSLFVGKFKQLLSNLVALHGAHGRLIYLEIIREKFSN